MKKTLAVICMAALCCTSAMAQFNWGIRGGVNMVDNDITAINAENAQSKDSYTGFFFGPMAEIQVPILGIGLDASLLYQQKGMELSDKETMKQQQIAVPLYLKYSLGLGNLASVFVQGGAQLNYNIGDLSSQIEEQKAGSEEIEFREYVLKKNTFSVNVGAGVKVMGHLQAAVNYNIPTTKEGTYEYFTKEDSQANKIKEGASKMKQSTLQFSLTYTF
ncbi:MAG: PorT family protein [Bacteroidaceae bacterium]|nr:PorT family protein [Bacteroidaceae bacterium]